MLTESVDIFELEIVKKINNEFISKHQILLEIDDFKEIEILGQGSFGQVKKVKCKDDIYAMKILRKK